MVAAARHQGAGIREQPCVVDSSDVGHCCELGYLVQLPPADQHLSHGGQDARFVRGPLLAGGLALMLLFFLAISGRSARSHQSLDGLRADRSGTGPRDVGNGEISSLMNCEPPDSLMGLLPFQACHFWLKCKYAAKATLVP